MNYGITNEGGRVPPCKVAAILGEAAASGMDVLDTAPLYGDSEVVLGRSTPTGARFRIVTKTPKFGPGAGADSAGELRRSLEESLLRLNVPRVHGLIFHDPADLLGPAGDDLWLAMEALRSEDLVQRIGLSTYAGAELDEALRRYPISLVQLPFNPLDHRLLAGGQLARLSSAQVEVHARSLFLQGLLLHPVPEITERFVGLSAALAEFDRACSRRGLDRLEGILAAAFSRPEIDCFLVGVTSLDELRQITAAAVRADRDPDPLEFVPSVPLDERVLNPARWPEL
jgi:aryl-alcohol dehydrogenase-like predicted oxidoreductase